MEESVQRSFSRGGLCPSRVWQDESGELPIPDEPPPLPIARRRDFVLVFEAEARAWDVERAIGLDPFVHPVSGRVVVSEVALKRRVRSFVLSRHGGAAPYDVHLRDDAVVAASERSTLANEVEAPGSRRLTGFALRNELCRRYFDVRAFGAVLVDDARKVRISGAVQLTGAVTIESASRSGASLRCARPDGRAVYRVFGSVAAPIADEEYEAMRFSTGFGIADLELLWQALEGMFSSDRAFARSRALVVFEHPDALAVAPARSLFDRVSLAPRGGRPRGGFDDYVLRIDDAVVPSVPRGVARAIVSLTRTPPLAASSGTAEVSFGRRG